MTNRTTATLLLAGALAVGCTARDFFGYRDDAPLHAVDRPDGYPRATFGAQIAPTFWHAAEGFGDLIAVSGGAGTPTIFYRLSADGKLVDVGSPWDEYLMDAKGDAVDWGSGAAVVGLPTWARRDGGGLELVTGCAAIGEPEAENVHIYCLEGSDWIEVDIPAALAGAADPDEFGAQLAAIRPTAGAAAWLLAAAGERFAVVFSADSADARSEPLVPTFAGEAAWPIAALAAGALGDDRFFVAVATGDAEEDAPGRLHLFLQAAPGDPAPAEVACVDRPGEPGFAGAMIAGDLDGDGDDELIVSAGAAEGRVDAVYVYEVAALAAAAPTCAGDAPEPAAVALPGDGPLDVGCAAGAGCEFGVALAVGDLATDDGAPELIVGAPGAKVDGKAAAGAVFVYRGAELLADGAAEVAGRVADSAPEKGQRFGGGVAAAPMAGRVELLAGATGQGKLFIAYCTGVGEDIEAGADVTENAAGKVVSTRCRPR